MLKAQFVYKNHMTRICLEEMYGFMALSRALWKSLIPTSVQDGADSFPARISVHSSSNMQRNASSSVQITETV